MIIKNKITDLSYLFNDERDGLRNIDELKYLDTSNVTNFGIKELIFHICFMSAPHYRILNH